jgi:hypothetical protein
VVQSMKDYMEDHLVVEHGRPRGRRSMVGLVVAVLRRPCVARAWKTYKGKAWNTSWWQIMEDLQGKKHRRPHGGRAWMTSKGKAWKTSYWQYMEDLVLAEKASKGRAWKTWW